MFRLNKLTGIVLLTTLALNSSVAFSHQKKKAAAQGTPDVANQQLGHQGL